MSYQVVIPVIISFVVSAVLGPIVIPFLRKLKVGQTEREELKSHLKKTGTPTMGGIIILASVILTSLIYVKDYPKIIPILFVTVGFGIVGFLDDYLKVVLKRSDGLLAWQKMLCQIVITAIFVFYILKFTDVSLTMLIPFSGGKYLNLGVLAIPVMFLAVIGTVNGVNFTDGLDLSLIHIFLCNTKREFIKIPENIRFWSKDRDRPSGRSKNRLLDVYIRNDGRCIISDELFWTELQCYDGTDGECIFLFN